MINWENSYFFEVSIFSKTFRCPVELDFVFTAAEKRKKMKDQRI